LPELGADALEPLNSGGVGLIDATSKASGLATGAEGTAGCAWIRTAPSKAITAGQTNSEQEQVRGVFTELGRCSRRGRWQINRTCYSRK